MVLRSTLTTENDLSLEWDPEPVRAIQKREKSLVPVGRRTSIPQSLAASSVHRPEKDKILPVLR
jgi:hypothetical protein